MPVIVAVAINGGKVEGAYHWWLLAPLLMVIAGVYCMARQYKAFIAYEMDGGASREAAKAKWKETYGLKPE